MNDGMNLVEHVNRTEAGQTKMQIKLPISLRAGMAALSKRLGISQLAIVRSALAAYLLANAEPVTAMAVPPEVTPLPALETAPEAPAEAIAESPAGTPGEHRGTRCGTCGTEAPYQEGEGQVITRVGPMIIFLAPAGETMATLQIAWRQDGCSTGVITRWDIDSDACCEQHMNKSWVEYWQAFLDMIPDEWVAEVAHSELSMRF